MAIDVTKSSERASVLEWIMTDEENLQRKRDHQRRFDVYQDRQAKYVEEILSSDLSDQTMREMRKVLSINIAKKIINEQASLYNQEATREFSNANERVLSQIENLYSLGKVDQNMRKANRFFKNHKQCFLMVLPMNGKVCVRPLAPHHLDVIPSPTNPELADTYILNVWDFNKYTTTKERYNKVDRNYTSQSDQMNEKAADQDDRLQMMRFIWWNKDVYFTTNGKGVIVDDNQEPNSEMVFPNPIGRLPFVDVSNEKDFKFFVDSGGNVTQFCLDFLTQLSDNCESSRLQAYAQAVIKAEKPPKNLIIGPQHVLFLPIDPARPEASPDFQFVSPNPNLGDSLSLLEAQVKFFLSAEGLDSTAISGSGDAQKFTSGVDRLLSMMDRFEASQTDMDIFRSAEYDVFDLIRLWSNHMQDVTDESKLDDELLLARIPDDVELSMRFAQPVAVETPSEVRERVRENLELGIMTKKEAIMELREVDEERAEEIMREVMISEGFQPNMDGSVDQGVIDGEGITE